MELPLAILISVLLSAFFSGMEIAFVTSNKLRFQVEKSKKKFSTSILSVFYDNPKQFIATMLVGNNIALVIYGILMAQIIEPFIFKFIQNDFAVVLGQTLISTLIILITAEFLPKALFRLNPSFFLNIFALPLLICYVLLYPISSFSASFSRLFLKLIGHQLPEGDNETAFGRIDLYHILEENKEHQNTPLETDVKLFQNALDFSKVKLRECIVPRTEIKGIEIEDSHEKLKQLFIESGHSKIIVYKETIDNIIGYIHLSDIFKNPQTLKSRIRKIPFVPETMVASKLMALFTQEKKSIAVVVDEFGGTSGIVTLEDIMEEIFGEIEDEHDSKEYRINQIDENHFELSARLEIDYVNEKLNLNLPESEDYETIAGLILYHNEHMPIVNDEISIENFTFKILKSTATRIELVHLLIA